MGDVRQGCMAYVLLKYAFGRDLREIFVLGFDKITMRLGFCNKGCVIYYLEEGYLLCQNQS